jgi:hypothetical protein
MQVVWDKIDYAGGEVHLPFSNKNYSYVLPLLLFDTLDLQDFRTTTRSSTRSKHRAQHMQSRKTRTIKNNAPIKKRLKKRIGGTQTQAMLRTELSLKRHIYREI